MSNDMNIGQALKIAVDASNEESMRDIFDPAYEAKVTKIFDSNFAKNAHGKAPAKTVVQRYPKGEITIKLVPMKATIYRQGEMFGGAPRGIEVKAFNFAVAPYAQYQKALHVYYIPKGKLNPRHFVDGYQPTTIIIEGWNHPAEAGATYHPARKTESGAIVSQSRYLAHDPRYTAEGKDFMDQYLKTSRAKVIIDFRR